MIDAILDRIPDASTLPGSVLFPLLIGLFALVWVAFIANAVTHRETKHHRPLETQQPQPQPVHRMSA